MSRADTVVLLCHGCCCGTRAKHFKVNRDQQEQILEAATDTHRGVEEGDDPRTINGCAAAA